MSGMLLAALTGEGILMYRNFKQNGGPAMPGQLLAASGVFVMLAFLAAYQPARFLATAMAWGFDVAALMNVLPGAVTGGTTDAQGPVAGKGAGAGTGGGGTAKPESGT